MDQENVLLKKRVRGILYKSDNHTERKKIRVRVLYMKFGGIIIAALWLIYEDFIVLRKLTLKY